MAEELENEYLRIEEDIVAALRTVYDPEIPRECLRPRADLLRGAYR